MKTFVAYFETKEENDEVSISSWGLLEAGSKEYCFGDTIEELMAILKYSKDSFTIYTLDLRIYGEFIFHYLYCNDYKLVKDKKEKENRTFTTLIGDNGKFYSIDIFFELGKRKAIKSRFLDINNILDLDIEELSENFLGLKYKTIEDDFERVKYHTEILSRAVEELKKIGMDRITIGSNALQKYKQTINFDRYYPTLIEPIDRYIRNAYKGGFCYLNPIYKSKVVEDGIVLDYNSAYANALKIMEMPFGDPVYFKGEYIPDPLYNLYVITFFAEFELKPGKIPTVQIKEDDEYDPTEYIESSQGETLLLTMTNVDFKLFKENYDIKYIEYADGFKFKSTIGLFDEYIDYWYREKCIAKEFNNMSMYMVAKKMLNALFGKFGTSPDVINKYPLIDEETGKIHYARYPKVVKPTVYVPVAAFCTAYVRDKLIRDCQKVRDYSIKKYNEDKYIYSDTDSLSCLLKEDELREILEIDNKELGKFKIEERFKTGKYIRTKCYILDVIEETKLKVKATVAGLAQRYMDNKKANIRIQDFSEGATIVAGKVDYEHKKGGVVRTQRNYKIR